MPHLGREALEPTALWQRFRAGAPVVELRDERVSGLWRGLNDLIRAEPFWENGVLDFARNHVAGQLHVGDMFRFVPGNYGHIARKIILYREPGDGGIRTIPSWFWTRGEQIQPCSHALDLAWELAEDVWTSSTPTGFQCPPHAVSLEVLKYPDSIHDLSKAFDLFADASGGWCRLGRWIDDHKATASGPFDRRYVRDAFALGCFLPGVGPLLRTLNARFVGRAPSAGSFVIGQPHTDTNRSVTMLSGDRSVIKTEIRDGTMWRELPLTQTSLFLFPSKLHSHALGVEPTVHRYSIGPPAPDDDASSPNVTIMLGLVDLQAYRSLAPTDQWLG